MFNVMMAASNISQNFLLFCLFGVIIMPQFANSACDTPLGMENEQIKDSQIKTSSVTRTAEGRQARLNKNIQGWGAWCPNYTNNGEKNIGNYDQYIEIDLLSLKKVTKVATQGREYNKGKEFVKEFIISYSKDNTTWMFFKDKDNSTNTKIFSGNSDVMTVVLNTIDPSITARYIRVHPGYTPGTFACMRLELYGCAFNQIIESYSLPVGQTTLNGKIKYEDTSYNGNRSEQMCTGGTGILTDGLYGPVNSKKFKGKGWVGWSTKSTSAPYIEITFHFVDVRKFKDVTLTVNVNDTRKNAVFNKSQIFFGNDTSMYLQYCPNKTPKNGKPYNANITLSLCENVAKFITMKLYFGGKWLLLTEVVFSSDPANNSVSFKNCAQDRKAACTVSLTAVSPTPRRGCADCTTLHSSVIPPGSNNFQMTIIIVCVILSIVIFLLILLFFLYRRRALCFGSLKHSKNKTDKTVHVELQNVRNGEDQTYDKIIDGNPLYASVGSDDDTKPMLSPVKKKSNENLEKPVADIRSSELYSEPDFSELKPIVQEEYAEPMDTLKPGKTPDDDLVANPIYEGIYSEPLYGIAGTILVGPQEETLKRGYTMEKFPRDRLVFKEKIGDGQFGEVHIAVADIRDLNAQFGEQYLGKTKVTVAVKTLKGDVSKDVKTDFFKEVRVMSRLQHENVVRLLGVCRDDPVCMIVEYMENGDLNQFLKGHVLEDNDDVMVYANTKQPISYSELIYIASQVAAGMKYFAAMKFVHRDLAARNCLVGDGLTVKLADFGMSRLLYSKHYYRVQGRVMLPIRWMAPESIFQGRFTTQTDVWSFGITLWEIFTLAQDFPYPDLADEQVIGNAKTAFTKGGAGVVYNEKPEICPQDVFDMMLACWCSNPNERPDFSTLYTFLQGKVGTAGAVGSVAV